MTALRRVLVSVAAGVALAGAMSAGNSGWAEERAAGNSAQRPKVLRDTPATANDLARARSQNSAQLAEDPTDPRFVAIAHRVDAPDFDCALQISGDAGRSWVPANPVPELPPGAEKCYAPEIAFDRDGVLYYLFIGLAGRGNAPTGVYLTTSDDRGRTFDEPRRLLGPNRYQVRMAIDRTAGERGRIHLVWLAPTQDAPAGGLPASRNPILASYSDDGGETFSRAVQVSDPDRELAVAPALAIGPDHAVHVVYYDLQQDRIDYQGLEGPPWQGPWSIVSTTSLDGGDRFGPGVVVDDRLKPPERVMLIFTMPPPALAVGASGRLFAAWYDARNGDWDAFLGRSRDNGRSWERPRRLNDDRVGNGRQQYLPRLSVAPSGRLDAIFLDRRDDPRNVRNHTYYTYSTDGGGNFAPNVRLTSTDSSSDHGQRYSLPSAKGLKDFGSRLGLLSRDSRALAAWTDTRNAFGERIFATATQDVYTTAMVFPGVEDAGASSSPRPGNDGPSLGGLLIAGAVAGLLLGAVAVSGRIRRTRRARLGGGEAA